MKNYYSLVTDDGQIDISYYDNSVLIHLIRGNGWDYLDSLIYSIRGKIIKPLLILIPNYESNTQIIRYNNFTASGIIFKKKTELYYKGDKTKIVNFLYNYFLDKDGIEPFNNAAFLTVINSPHKTIAYRLDTFVTI